MATRASSTKIALLGSAALLLGLAAGSRYLSAGGSAAASSEPGPLTLQHATVVLSDFEASMAFYQGILGLEEIPAPFLPERLIFLAVGEGLELHMGEVPGVEIRPSTFNHFALTASDFDGFLDRLREQGIVYSNLGGGEDYYVQTRGDGVRQTFFQDPDGYWIEVNDFR